MMMIAAGIAVLTGLGAGIGIGLATGKATEAIADSRKLRVISTRHCCWVVLWQKQLLFTAS